MEKLINKEIFNTVKSDVYRLLILHIGDVANYFSAINNGQEKEIPTILKLMPASLYENRTVEEAAAIFLDMLCEAIENLDNTYNEVKGHDS